MSIKFCSFCHFCEFSLGKNIEMDAIIEKRLRDKEYRERISKLSFYKYPDASCRMPKKKNLFRSSTGACCRLDKIYKLIQLVNFKGHIG